MTQFITGPFSINPYVHLLHCSNGDYVFLLKIQFFLVHRKMHILPPKGPTQSSINQSLFLKDISSSLFQLQRLFAYYVT